jgi:iron complex outermembrane receptor protein
MQTRSRSQTRWALALSASALACGSQPASAQNQIQAEEPARNAIVVTAQFREQFLQDTPLAITAVNADMLEARSQTNLSEVANQAPSVILRPQSASFGPSITATIRGLGQYDFNPLVEPGVGIYIDDVYYPRLIGANLELLDVERVEILRGPQGTLTGRNSEGGAIRFVSRRPDGTLGGYGEATVGSRERLNLRAGLEFPLGEDFAGRVTGAYARQDGYVQGYDYGCVFPESGVPTTRGDKNCKTADFGDVKYHAVRGVLRYNPNSTVDVQLIGDYTENDTWSAGDVLLYANNTNPNVATPNGLPYDNRFICGRYCTYTDFGYAADSWKAGLIPGLQGLPVQESRFDNRNYYEGWGVSLNAEFEINDAIGVTSITAYRHFFSDFSNDADASPARINGTYVSLDTDFFSQELRLNAELSQMIDLTVGGYYSKEDTFQDTVVDIRYIAVAGLPVFPLQQTGGGPVAVESYAAFGTVFLRPMDDLTITLGGRYTDETKETTYERLNFDRTTPNGFVDPIGAAYGIGYSGPDTLDTDRDGNTAEIVNALNGLTSTYSGSRFDYRASVDYRVSDELLVYATTSTGFKGGGISPRPFNAGQAVPFGEEELVAYEIGAKTDLFDNRVRFNVAGYINKYKDAQLTLLSCPQFGGPGPCALPQNAGDATIKGFEAELQAEPIDGFDINASFSVLDWTWDCVQILVVRALNPGEQNVCSTDPAILSVPSSPPRGVVETQWSIGAQYQFDIPGAYGSLTPRVDVSYSSEMAANNSKPAPGSPGDLYGRIPSFTLTNARLTWRDVEDLWAVSLAVTNVFDKYYFYQTFDLTQAGSGVITGNPARPREWAFSLKRSF